MFTHSFGMNCGLLDAGKVWSPVQMVLDVEMVNLIRAMFRNLNVTDETLALDLTREVALGEHRTFIDAEHTAALFRQHLWHPLLLDCANWQGDMAERNRDHELLWRADQTWQEALRHSPPFELSAEKRRAVEQVLRRARADLL
jgi:trimethylamine:corrinoid methyltransferase-like protein